jgi:hypothetical protein
MIGRPLSREAMLGVVRSMAELEQPWNCPHGRPTLRHLVDVTQVTRGSQLPPPLPSESFSQVAAAVVVAAAAAAAAAATAAAAGDSGVGVVSAPGEHVALGEAALLPPSVVSPTSLASPSREPPLASVASPACPLIPVPEACPSVGLRAAAAVDVGGGIG